MEKPAEKIEGWDRRVFLFRTALFAGLGILGAALGWIFGDFWTAASRFSSARWVPLAMRDRFSFEGVVPFPEYKLAIVRTGTKIGAISLECTHLGCLLNTVDRGFFCPCHGSDFGPLGEVYSGPATVPLPWHDVMDRDGKLWVHLGEKIEQPKWIEIETVASPGQGGR
jgi:cytochrome b6-f complex iron-sulfur subunit